MSWRCSTYHLAPRETSPGALLDPTTNTHHKRQPSVSLEQRSPTTVQVHLSVSAPKVSVCSKVRVGLASPARLLLVDASRLSIWRSSIVDATSFDLPRSSIGISADMIH